MGGGGAYVALAMGVVTIAVVIAIGLYVTSTVHSSIDRSGFDAATNATFDTIVSTTNSGFTLLAVLIIVIAAAAILGALIWQR